MPGAPAPYLSRATRAALRDVAASLTFSQVSRVFRDEGFADHMLMAVRAQPAAESKWMGFLQGLASASKFTDPRSVVDFYIEAVDWASPTQTLAALRAVEEMLWLFDRSDDSGDDWDSLPGERLRRQLAKDGCRVDEQGRIHPAANLFVTGAIAALDDPSLIRQILLRITRAVPDDPMLAIGSAKELVEATCKAVLVQLGQPVSEADLPGLVRKAEEALAVHPRNVDQQLDGGPAVRRLLGRVTAIADDLAALRNTCGTGHAPAALPQGLQPRHGRLAVAAADAWCTFILDELAAVTTTG
ncbi:abortive infection family protein [Amycolatopsis camponoti]|nr:abortive infection family protein [Amycolatopsis camponoti]